MSNASQSPRKGGAATVVLALIALVCAVLLSKPNLVRIGESLNLTFLGLKLAAATFAGVAAFSLLSAILCAHRAKAGGFIAFAYGALIAFSAFGVAHVLPSFGNWQHKDDAQTCAWNLRGIVFAKEMYTSYMLDHGKTQAQLNGGDAVPEAELNKFLPERLHGPPKCPSGGKYAYGGLGQAPFCSVHGSDPEDPSARPLALQDNPPAGAHAEPLGKAISYHSSVWGVSPDGLGRF